MEGEEEGVNWWEMGVMGKYFATLYNISRGKSTKKRGRVRIGSTRCE